MTFLILDLLFLIICVWFVILDVNYIFRVDTSCN